MWTVLQKTPQIYSIFLKFFSVEICLFSLWILYLFYPYPCSLFLSESSSLSWWIVLKNSQLRMSKFRLRKISWKLYICRIFWVFRSSLVIFLLFLTIIVCFNSLLVLKGSTRFIITWIRHRYQKCGSGPQSGSNTLVIIVRVRHRSWKKFKIRADFLINGLPLNFLA